MLRHDSHTSGTTGATARFAFTGSQVLLHAAYGANAGIMGVTIADSSGAPITPELPVSLRCAFFDGDITFPS